jgi:hypothetical protein
LDITGPKWQTPEIVTTPYQHGHQSPSNQVQYSLGTAKLNKKFGAFGTVIWIILGVVLAGAAIWSLVAQSIVPIGLAVVAGVVVLMRRLLGARRSAVIRKRPMGTLTIGVQGIAIANVQGTANVFPWTEIDAIGVLEWKDNIAFRSSSARIAQLLPPMRPGVPVYLPISLIYVEAPREEVVAALRYYAGGRFAGVDLEKDALAR